MDTSIVCMVRGGESGRLVQEMAIEAAMKENHILIFLHIIDPHGFSARNETSKKAWLDEMIWLGQVTLGLARQRALGRGIRCKLTILTGPIFSTTVQFVKENSVAQLFIGSPHDDCLDYEQRLARIRKFADQIYSATGAKVIIASRIERINH
jgi:hypothetical protein